MSRIQSVTARQILDSRGNPTVEVDVITNEGVLGRAAVPSGASTGEHEAVELRDGDDAAYLGKGVLDAVDNVIDTLGPELEGTSVFEQAALDRRMIEIDGTPNKGNLGANAILGVSLAAAKAAAATAGLPLYAYLGGPTARTLPVPLMNILNGGRHADNNVDMQEFMIAPVGAASFSDALRMGTETFHHLKKVLHAKGYNTAVGDEGGFAPNLRSNEEAIEVILEAVEQAGYSAGDDLFIALDPAAAEMYESAEDGGGHYVFYKSDPDRKLTSAEMVDFWAGWVDEYPIISIEDALDENDWRRLDGAHRCRRRPRPTRRRRPVRDQHRAAPARDRRGRGQLDLDQAQPDRHAHRDHRRHRTGAPARLHLDRFAPLRRDRGHDDCRPRRGAGHRPDQDRLGQPLRPDGEVQPTAPHRGSARRRGGLPRPGSLPVLGRVDNCEVRLARGHDFGLARSARRSGP